MIEEKEVSLCESSSDESDDQEPIQKEINTYNTIPFTKFTVSPESNPKPSTSAFLKKVYSFAAILTVFLAIVFSSAEILDFILNDMGTENMIMKRIFSRDLMGQGLNLNELIIKNSFIVLETDASKKESHETPEETIPSQESLNVVPIQTPGSSLPETTPPETTVPPASQPEAPPVIPENGLPILPMDMSLLSYGKYYIYNDTDLSPNVVSLASASLKNYYQSDQPLVLVIHTHGTESYMPEGAKYYVDDGEIARSSNTSENMIAVGAEFVKVLEENGISALHCTIMHDEESYRESYSRSAETIKKYLEQYPSIKYVFDIHRDSLMRSTGELISAVTSINGESCAQIMPVVGSGFNGWESNMTFALKLREQLNEEFINLCRPACLRSSTYNQSMSAVSLILEVGTSGNSLSEAKKAAALSAEAIAEIIKNG